jgi:hypothetical protein
VSDSLSNLLSAMLGAIVGGVLTLTGSVLVNRWEAARNARLRLYEELIPRANESFYKFAYNQDSTTSEQGTDADMKAIWRASVLAGRREVRVAKAIREAWGALTQSPGQLADLALETTSEAVEEFHYREPKLRDTISAKLYELETLLERRLK